MWKNNWGKWILLALAVLHLLIFFFNRVPLEKDSGKSDLRVEQLEEEIELLEKSNQELDSTLKQLAQKNTELSKELNLQKEKVKTEKIKRDETINALDDISVRELYEFFSNLEPYPETKSSGE